MKRHKYFAWATVFCFLMTIISGYEKKNHDLLHCSEERPQDPDPSADCGAAIAREIADVTISEDDLHSLIVMKQISDGLMRRIRGNYRSILTFNSFLILMGILGIFPSTTTALLHNMSTIGISLHSMTNLLPAGQT